VCRRSGAAFGSPLVLSRVHWVKPKLVAETTYLTWTDGLLRHTVYVGLREDKPATDALQDASSVAGLTITTEAMVAETPKGKEAPAMPLLQM
jgi:ATP-dependent DNA ligase